MTNDLPGTALAEAVPAVGEVMGTTIVVASGDWKLRRVVRTAIRSERCRFAEASSYDDAMSALLEHRPKVSIVDADLRGHSGLDLIRAVKAEPVLAATRVVLIADLAERTGLAVAVAAGADAYITRPFSPRELIRRVEMLAAASAVPTMPLDCLTDDEIDEARRARANVRLAYAFRMSDSSTAAAPGPIDPVQMAHAVEDAQQLRLVEDFRDAHQESRELARQLERAYQQTITALAKAVEARDLYTGGHVERVRRYSIDIGQRLGIADGELQSLAIGAVLHDVGKIGVPDAVLTKPGPLDRDEWQAMRRHPEIGRALLAGISFLSASLDAVAHHHERWDGGGYPGGLSHQEIPVAGRIVAVADAFDAMTTTRPYRDGLPAVAALGEIRRASGTSFDPEVVTAFAEVAPVPMR